MTDAKPTGRASVRRYAYTRPDSGNNADRRFGESTVDLEGRMTAARVRHLLGGDTEPLGVGIDPETIAAARRIARHLNECGL